MTEPAHRDRPRGLDRREALTGLALLGGALLTAGGRRAAATPAREAPRVVLPALPWAETALQPHVSARTLGFHHGKHHRAYVDATVKLIQATPFARLSLEEIVRRTAGKPEHAAIFNNAAQVWNHTFYWTSLKPKAAAPTGPLLDRLKRDLGGVAGVKTALVQAGLAQFGSGWAWLVVERGKLKVTRTPNAETPLTQGQTALLTIDVWEHAYYLDFQNRRADYLQAVVDHLLDWDRAALRLKAAPR
jgi:Fe-Mn family superoxide dismutase